MTTSCPICGSSRSTRKFQVRDPHYGIPGEWGIVECASCASLFLEDPPSAERLAALYPEDSYYAYTPAAPSRIKRILHSVVGYSNATREPPFAAPGTLLDFGCGAGEFLVAMRARGWKCAGVEINPAARARARSAGLDVRPTISGPDGFGAESFDYVRANHSLEHVLNPGEVLADMYRVLKPGGTLFLGVPTASSVNARRFGPHWWFLTPPLHAFVPTTPALQGLVERTGFTLTRMSTNSDYTSIAGSLQIRLNHNSNRRSAQGLLFAIKPLLLLSHWLSKLQDLVGAGDKLELIARKPIAPSTIRN